jgi:arginyl-tRNA synthetase
LKPQLEQLLTEALRNLPAELGLSPTDIPAATVERTRDPQHGDFATNIAMRLAKAARRNPRDLAKAIVAALPASPLVARTEIAGAGFINFFLTPDAYRQELARIHEMGDRYGESDLGKQRRVIVEFVSANPTGPLHVAHGRHAAYGASLSNLLAKAGYSVHREYYINDAGRQMDILAVSLWLRYLEVCGESLPFPSGGYQGEYLKPVAEELKQLVGESLRRPASEVLKGLPPDGPEEARDAHVDALIARARELIGEASFQQVYEFGLEKMLAGIRNDLEEFGVTFDRWFSERSLETSGAIARALEKLQSQGRLYKKDGALWFRATEFGDEKDRVVVRENGLKTYFASDIAYHFDKRERGFELLIDVLGSGHHGYIARVRAGLLAMGEPGDCLEVPLIQVVTLYRGKEQVQMSKRSGQFVTLRQLRTEVGNDACRIFFLMRDNDQPLDFDLELAKSRNNENPVFYIQYAHARVASMLKELAARGFPPFDLAEGLANFTLLKSPHEQAVLTALTRYPELIEQAATNRAPHAVVHYLRDLANAFHTYYNAEKVLVEDSRLRNARLALVVGVQQVIRNGLTLLGASAPESM